MNTATKTHAELEVGRLDVAWDDDGCLVDAETGEVLDLGFVLGGSVPDAPDDRFAVDDRERAEWALSRRAEVESRIVALKRRRDALTANLDAQIRAEERRLAWWDYRFFPGVVAVARRMLRGKGRTAQFDHGKVGFRTVAPRPKLVDEAEALRWMKAWAPGRVQVRHEEWVTATDAAKALDEVAAELDGEVLSHPWLKYEDARESVTIKTGVTAPGKGDADAD